MTRLQALLDHPHAPWWALATCTLTGTLLGLFGPWADWGPLPRVVAGTVVGAFSGLILTARRLLG